MNLSDSLQAILRVTVPYKGGLDGHVGGVCVFKRDMGRGGKGGREGEREGRGRETNCRVQFNIRPAVACKLHPPAEGQL